MSEDLLEQYLAGLRASLRGTPEKSAQILAEAEDHLSESVAAGRTAGLTERDAQQAAISASGTVRAVVRAHQRPPASRADLSLAACQAAGVYLLTICAVSFAVYAVVWQATSTSPPGRHPFATPRGYAGSPTLWPGCGAAGLVLLCGCYAAHRVRRHRATAQGEVPGGFYPLATAVFCVALTAALMLAGRAARLPHGLLPHGLLPHGLLPWATPAALVTAAGYVLRMIGLSLTR